MSRGHTYEIRYVSHRQSPGRVSEAPSPMPTHYKAAGHNDRHLRTNRAAHDGESNDDSAQAVRRATWIPRTGASSTPRQGPPPEL